MKIITTAVLLGITLLFIPVFTYFFGTPLGATEWQALETMLLIMAVAILYTFILGEITNNNSQVDKLWSLLPIVYVWIAAYYGGFSLRLVIMAVLASIWGIRLTINFALKGAYNWRFWAGEEDYRWVVLRQKPQFKPKWKWTLFNLFFISAYQNVLIFMFTTPSLIALQNPDSPIGIIDFIAIGLFLFFVLFETIADIQQWNYQSYKWRKIRKGEPLEGIYQKGFLDKGLWALSRHPNYFGEQGIWISFYLFALASGGQWLNWTISGCLLLIVLFQGSSNFSEEISSGKYPEYSQYKLKTPKFIPVGNLFRKR